MFKLYNYQKEIWEEDNDVCDFVIDLLMYKRYSFIKWVYIKDKSTPYTSVTFMIKLFGKDLYLISFDFHIKGYLFGLSFLVKNHNENT
jgi:hypothetical protein